MPICPECKGEKQFEIQTSEYWQEPVQYETINCSECNGKGKVSRTKLAVYKARGGSKPGSIKGFA